MLLTETWSPGSARDCSVRKTSAHAQSELHSAAEGPITTYHEHCSTANLVTVETCIKQLLVTRTKAPEYHVHAYLFSHQAEQGRPATAGQARGSHKSMRVLLWQRMVRSPHVAGRAHSKSQWPRDHVLAAGILLLMPLAELSGQIVQNQTVALPSFH